MAQFPLSVCFPLSSTGILAPERESAEARGAHVSSQLMLITERVLSCLWCVACASTSNCFLCFAQTQPRVQVPFVPHSWQLLTVSAAPTLLLDRAGSPVWSLGVYWHVSCGGVAAVTVLGCLWGSAWISANNGCCCPTQGQPAMWFQSALSALPGGQTRVHMLLKSRVQASHSLLVSPSSPTGQAGSSPLCKTPRLGHPIYGSNHLLPRVDLHPCILSFPLSLFPGAQVLTWSLFFPSYPITCGSILQPWLYRSLSASFQLDLVRILPHVGVILMCAWREVNITSSYAAILIYPPGE